MKDKQTLWSSLVPALRQHEHEHEDEDEDEDDNGHTNILRRQPEAGRRKGGVTWSGEPLSVQSENILVVDNQRRRWGSIGPTDWLDALQGDLQSTRRVRTWKRTC